MKRGKIIEDLEISGIAAGGRGLGRHNGKVVFVDGAIPGDVVNARVKKDKRDYTESTLQEITSPSPFRETPRCIHFDDCGGCKWQYLNYEKQLEFKEQIVRDNFRHLGKVEVAEVQPILGAPEPYLYRNKMEFTFASQRWITKAEVATGEEFEKTPGLGLHPPKTFGKVVDLKECHLQGGPSNDIRLAVRKYAEENGLSFYDIFGHTGFLRTLLIRTNRLGEAMVVLVMAEDKSKEREEILEFLASSFSQITSLNYCINQKKNDSLFDQEIINWKGSEFLLENLGEVKYKISPKSFFQTNTKQAENLYGLVDEFADLKGDEFVFDLYCGTGSIALFLAAKSAKVVGIETVADAIRDAKDNAALNGISNCEFLLGDVKDVLNEKFRQEHGSPDVLITDPPRAGMDKKVVASILELAPRKIVYVSCNPSTQARDLQLLSEDYDLLKSRAVDMFPQTYHIENVVLLQRKTNS